MTPARWLVDRSVLVRLDHGAVAEGVLLRLRAGQVGVARVTELEVGFSARWTRDDTATRDDVLDHLLPVALLVLSRSEPASPRRTWAAAVNRGVSIRRQVWWGALFRAVHVRGLGGCAVRDCRHGWLS